MPFAVYKARFKTKKKTKRAYIGSSSNTTQREETLQKTGEEQPIWLRAGCFDFQLDEVVGLYVGTFFGLGQNSKSSNDFERVTYQNHCLEQSFTSLGEAGQCGGEGGGLDHY